MAYLYKSLYKTDEVQFDDVMIEGPNVPQTTYNNDGTYTVKTFTSAIVRSYALSYYDLNSNLTLQECYDSANALTSCP